MAIEIKPYTENLIGAVKDFNLRLQRGGATFRFPESNVSQWLPKIDERRIFQEYFLALEGDVVRGGFILKHQVFSFKGEIISIGGYQLPLSEGIVNQAYRRVVGLQLLTDALRRKHLLFALGMGGFQQPLPRMLKTAGWSLCAVPFFFKVNHPFRFLRGTTFLRRVQLKRSLLDFLAITGLGWIGIRLLQALLRKQRRRDKWMSFEEVNDFSDWSDQLWTVCKDKYSMIAVRDSQTLNILYPSGNKRFIRLKVLENQQVVGWAVVLNTQMWNHKHFGNLRVGSIVDTLALPENAFPVIRSATRFLERAGADIIVSNHSHITWCSAFKDGGFISGPSNFIFAASKKLAQLLHPFEQSKQEIHLNRGDGPGPINL